MKNLETLPTRQFQDEIFAWWKNNKREFPWRQTTNPYHILVSEMMLQQTQATRVVPKYNLFITEFPEMSELIKASNAKILKLWSGLGYNKRALWLKEITKSIGNINNFPKSPNELTNFKGIGRYTSNSILIFAFNYNLCAVDINIKKTLLNFNFINRNTNENQIYEICKQLLPQDQSSDWHNALMDFGALKLK
ncbi:MAG: putative A/G-specific adenine glycosylase YfhQ, partial [Candidatus Heimdallarchaeota archaeon LC_2]